MSRSADPGGTENRSALAAGSEQFLADAAALLAESLDLQTILGKLTELAVASFADFCLVDLLDDELERAESFERVAISGRAPQSAELTRALKRRYTLRGPTLSGVSAVLLEGKSILLRDFPEGRLGEIARDPEHLQALRALHGRSALSVPLIARGRVLGALSFIACTRNFDEKDQWIGRQLAHLAAPALENARLYEAERRARRQITRLQEVTAALSRASTSAEVTEVACRIGAEATEAQSGALWLADGSGGLELSNHVGTPGNLVSRFQHIDAGSESTPAIRVLRTGEPIWVQNRADYARIAPDILQAVSAENWVRAFGAVPISLGGAPAGVMVFSHPEGHVYDANERAFYAVLAQHCSHALERARLLDTERRLREAERRTNEFNRLLARASRAFAESLGLDDTLRAVAKLVVPELADWCVIDIIEGDLIRRVATEHRDPKKAAAATERAARRQVRVGDNSPIDRVVARAESHFHRQVEPEVLARAAQSPEELARLQSEGIVSAIVVPLFARGVAIGALSLTTADSGRIYDESDLVFAEELGRRAGLAIANARMHHALAEAHERMRRLFERAPIAMAIYRGNELRLESANPEFLRARARGRDIVGKTYAEAFPETNASAREVLEAALRTGQPQTYPEVFALIDRGRGLEESYFHVSVVALRDQPDGVDRVMSVSFDVTERVAVRRALDAERSKLRTVFKQAPFSIGVFEGREHRIVLANERWEALVGRSLPPGVRLIDAVPELEAQGVLAMHDRAFAGETVVGNELPLELLVNGQRRLHYFQVILHPLHDATGNIEGHVTMALDVTEQVRARSVIETARSEAEAANRAKDDFLAMLGHELRNPLAPIVTALELMRQRGVEGAEREHTIISRQVQHLTRLVNDLLDVSRITQGKVELVKEAIEVSELVARAIETTEPLFEQREQRVSVRVPASGFLVEVDPTRMVQALSNLLSNAAKYSDRRGEIAISAARDGAQILIQVRDDGVGIRREMLDRIFDLFVQEQQALDRARGGLGLGLAIVKSVVGMHRGSITASSDGLGRGSVFSLRLPASGGTARSERPRAGAKDVTRAPSSRRVLVVDDNEDAAELLAFALEAAGHETRVAHDGPSALLALDHFAADAALLDIGLPGMDGYELAKRIRAHSGDVRLIAITGYGQDSDRKRARDAGFHGHLVKPVDLQLVLSALGGEPA